MQACQRIMRRSASNLALAFILLPREKRSGMTALYAFCREVDDVVDEDIAPIEERRTRLRAWRADLETAFGTATPQFPVNRELQPVIARYHLPFEPFDDLLRGVEMDLDHSRYETFQDLELYCYRVASVVGLLSIEIFGYRDPGCRTYAVNLGKALQLTNILRDVATDAQRNRLYLPLEELRRCHVEPEEVLRGQYSPRFAALASSLCEHATAFYRAAREALPGMDRRAMAAAELMGALYWRLLGKIAARQFDVFNPPRLRLSKPLKLFLIARTGLRVATGCTLPNYGF